MKNATRGYESVISGNGPSRSSLDWIQSELPAHLVGRYQFRRTGFEFAQNGATIRLKLHVKQGAITRVKSVVASLPLATMSPYQLLVLGDTHERLRLSAARVLRSRTHVGPELFEHRTFMDYRWRPLGPAIDCR
ncbi:hypothetical protein LshimejAT787_0505740 [Lyophyllum shimeji]|uniref:Uncharacterized protein n=1 Tax=Lyophyllum shimeji TaxID=47721 RepID=A0A9P3UL04_LYOSH|nr:hypothetical protein LshimejAT787_0505740 [Lyophyllum shimeji]